MAVQQWEGCGEGAVRTASSVTLVTTAKVVLDTSR